MSASFATLVIVFISVGVLVCAAAVWLTAWSLLHPPRMTDGKAMWVLRRLSPEDLGMPLEDVEFHVRDEHARPLKIVAWWIAHPDARGRCAVLIHGYADAKVGAIAWGLPWRALGFNLLVIDLRAHGESGGKMCTAGFFEGDDLRQVLDELRASKPDETKQLVLFGVSMGAAVAAAAAEGREDVAALVLDSPYARFESAAIEHIGRLGLPAWLGPPALHLAGWLSGAKLGAMAVQSSISRIRCPALVIESEGDLYLPQEDRKLLEEAIRTRQQQGGMAELWTVAAAEHLMVMAADPKRYQERLGQFLEIAVPSVTAVDTNRGVLADSAAAVDRP